MSSLSVLCGTRDPGGRVRALLEPLRAVADEIVVAVDSRAGDADLADYAAVADRVFRYERGPTHSSLTWLHEQCRGEWVLTLAGDEVASPALVEQLPELIRRRDALQYWLPLRWLFPDGATWLAGPPWHPDFHNRLVRNDGTLRFAGVKHELARSVYPARWVEAPIWHLALLLADVDERRAKVARNEAERPGLEAPGGRPLNEAYYLPEEAPALHREPLGEADRRAVAAVLAAPARTPGLVPPAGVPLVPRPEVERRWSGRAVGQGAYRAALETLERTLVLRPGEGHSVHVRVRNDGDELWPWGHELLPAFRLGHRWLDPHGRPAGPDVLTPFPHDVEPGETCVARVPVVAPGTAGRFDLEVDVVHQDVRWFGHPARLSVEVAG